MTSLFRPVALAGGAVAAGIAARRQRRKSSLVHVLIDGEAKTGVLLKPEPKRTIARARQLTQEFVDQTRQQQPAELETVDDSYQVHALKSEQDRRISASVLSLGIASVGWFIYPPLSLLSLPGIVFAASTVFNGAYQSLVKEKKANVDVIVAVVLTANIVAGDIWIASVLTCLAMYNRKLLARIKGDSKAKVIDVFRQQPRYAYVLTEDGERQIPIEAVSTGDIVVAQAGGVIPVDGRIVRGTASIDQHMLTGESQPAEKGVGDEVYAATMLLSGEIQIEVLKAGNETTAAQIGAILNSTINFKTDMQLKVEEFADRTVTPTLLASALSVPWIGPVGAVALLNAHPKFKPTMATYICILRYFEVASRNGLLIKDGRVLELLNQVDTIVFDKTGTLTEEKPHVVQVHTCSAHSEREVLALAAAAEMKQTHPLAYAIRQAAEEQHLAVPDLDDADYRLGYGLTVTINNRLVRVGSRRFIHMEGIPIPASIEAHQTACHEQGNTLVLVSVDAEVVGAIELQATVRPEAKAIIAGLRRRGIQSMYIISGDHERATRSLAESLEIDHYFAETLPEQKADLIEQLQQDGHTVCYIGDGINDAIALRMAAVSISLRGASSVATDTAQVILMDETLAQLNTLFDLARDFEVDMKRTSALVIAPHLFTVAGVLFWHWGLLASILFNQIGLVLGVGNALLVGRGRPTMSSNPGSRRIDAGAQPHG